MDRFESGAQARPKARLGRGLRWGVGVARAGHVCDQAGRGAGAA